MVERHLIIFLDIDGVLVSHGNNYYPQCIDNLNHITDATSAVIVVSSSRRVDGLEAMRIMLHNWGVTGSIVGLTPDLSRYAKNGIYITGERGREIQEWLNENECKNFVVLDDDNDMAYLASRLIRTDYETGLTQKDANRAIEYLRNPITKN